MSATVNNFNTYSDADWQSLMDQPYDPNEGITAWKYTCYVVSLAYQYVMNIFSEIWNSTVPYITETAWHWDWWNEVITEENGATLVLSALPISFSLFGHVFRNDANALKEEFDIEAILSVVEPFEMWISPEELKAKGIKQLVLSSEDFGPVPLQKVIEGVEFIRYNLMAGRSVDVHCKAGRGRSAQIVLCYLIKYHHMSAEDGLKYMKEKRFQVSLRGKWDTILEYERFIKT